ncbi:MAG: hypothetical protein E7184_01735 [Erysipelotrichaceae bacterium]|nr:hypothetical protein [Erysipelotrichaceae bacterium]
MERIIVYDVCCTTHKATKYLNDESNGKKIVPLAIRIEDEKLMNQFLETGYYKRLPYDLSPEGIFLGDYLVYDYKRNQILKDTGNCPEIEGILCKDFVEDRKYILKNVQFFNSMECNLLSTASIDCLDIWATALEKVQKDINKRTSKDYSHKKYFILEGSYPFSVARKFLKKGISPLHIIKDNSMVSNLTGSYKKNGENYDFRFLPDLDYDCLVRVKNNKPYFSKIVQQDGKTGIIVLEDDSFYDVYKTITKLK